MADEKAALFKAIADEEARLVQLDEEQRAVRLRLQDLRGKIAAIKTEEPPLATPPTLSPEAKITLFRSLFRGREDLFPKQWADRKSDRKGYAPACSMEWAPKQCGKVRRPPIKCGDCDNRAFIPVSDKVIEDHLRGKQTIGAYGQVIVDECHHLPAVSFERVLSEVKARYVVGLTATPYRRDGHQAIIHLQCGPTRFSLHRKQHSQDESFVRRLIMRETGFTIPTPDSGITIQELYARLSTDRQRNLIILDDIRQTLGEGRSPILLTERKDHLEFFAKNLRETVRHMVVLHGGMGTKKRRAVMDQLAAIPDDEERLILATGRYIGEGFDDARLDTLFLALPFSWKGMLVQYAGRLHRQRPGKEEVRVHDYMDNSVPMLAKIHDKRMRGFRAMGYMQTRE